MNVIDWPVLVFESVVIVLLLALLAHLLKR